MRTNQAAPAAPAPDANAAPAPGADLTELQVAAPATLEEAAPAAAIAEPTEPREPETPHSRQMTDIVAARRRVLAAEEAAAVQAGFAPQADPAAAQPQPDPQAPAPAAQAPVGAANPAPAPGDSGQAAAPAPAAPGAPAAPVRTHKITVRGQALDLSEDDLRRAAELGVDSEIRIRQANATLAEAQRITAAAGQPPNPGAGASSPPAATPQAQQQAPPGQDRAAMLEIAREFLYGDEEKVADALQRAFAGRGAPAIDPEQLGGQVYARVQQTLQLQHSLNTFATEYGEIVADPDLATLAANYVQQLRGHYAQTGTQRDELSLYREAGNAVRQALGRWGAPGAGAQPGGSAAPTPQPVLASPPVADGGRTVLKRNMPQAPAAGAAQPSMATAPARTASDIVNDMRKARGQPVYG